MLNHVMNRLVSLSLVSGVLFGLADAAMAAPQSAGSRELVAATLTSTTNTPPALSGAVVDDVES